MNWNHSELLVVIDEAMERNSTINTLKSDVAILKSDVAILKSDVAILKSDVAILKSDVAILKSDVAILKSDVAILKSDVAILQSDVAILKSDVAILKSDVAILKSDVASLKSDVQSLTHQGKHHSVLIAANTTAIEKLTSEQFRLNGLMEEMGRDIKKLVEMLLPSKRRDEQFDRLDITVLQHENRLCAVEATIKDRFAKSP